MATTAANDGSFKSEVIEAPTTVLVDFWAEWCSPCKALGPKLEEISNELNEKVKVVKVDIDESPTITAEFGVRSIPTMILFKDGKQVDQIMGNQSKENIIAFIEKHA